MPQEYDGAPDNFIIRAPQWFSVWPSLILQSEDTEIRKGNESCSSHRKYPRQFRVTPELVEE
jgi:hypothetical protein